MKNKIICGKSEEVLPILPANSFDLVVTSPPYYGARMWELLWYNMGLRKKIEQNGSQKEFIQVHNWLSKIWRECYRILKPSARLIINITDVPKGSTGLFWNSGQTIINCRDKIGFLYRDYIIWNKKGKANMAPTGSAPRPYGILICYNTEFLLVFQKPGTRNYSSMPKEIIEKSKLTYQECRWIDINVWTIPPAHGSKRMKHIAPFPLEIPYRLIKLYTYIDDSVIDPFNGSGTTCMAAKQLKRNYMGIDSESVYCKIAIQQLEQEYF